VLSRTRRGRRGLGGVPRGGGFGLLTGGGFITLRGGAFKAEGGNRRFRGPAGRTGIGALLRELKSFESIRYSSASPTLRAAERRRAARRGTRGLGTCLHHAGLRARMLAEGGVCHHVAAVKGASEADPARKPRAAERAKRVVRASALERGRALAGGRASARARRAHRAAHGSRAQVEVREKGRRVRPPHADAALRCDLPQHRELEPRR
jgi:hypothetical protein